jgi:hypothetical protein
MTESNTPVYVLTIIDLRCHEPDAYTSVFKNKIDAIQHGIQFARNNDCTKPDEDLHEEIDDGDGINIRNELYILPIDVTYLK